MIEIDVYFDSKNSQYIFVEQGEELLESTYVGYNSEDISYIATVEANSLEEAQEGFDYEGHVIEFPSDQQELTSGLPEDYHNLAGWYEFDYPS